MGGAAGRLARDNSRRNPQRTASTASALMIGLALVTLVSVLAASIVRASGRRQRHLHRRLRDHGAEQLLADPDLGRGGCGQAPGVTAVGSVRSGEVLVFGEADFATAVDGAASRMSLDWKEVERRSRPRSGDDGVFVDDGFADEHDLQIGSPVQITFANGTSRTFVVKGIFDPPPEARPSGR